jgi:hypothetical protein
MHDGCHLKKSSQDYRLFNGDFSEKDEAKRIYSYIEN